MSTRVRNIFVLGILLFATLCVGITIWWKVTASNPRSFPGRYERFSRGEPLLAQYANDLAEDIRTIPDLAKLQPWAMEVLSNAKIASVESNLGSPLYWTDKAVRLPPKEIPEFIRQHWCKKDKSGWISPPDVVVVFSDADQPSYVVVDWWSYGVAVGTPDYRLTFRAVVTNEVASGIYTYFLSK